MLKSPLKHTAFILSLYKIGAIRFGEFIFKSGLISKIYLDLRQTISYPSMLRSLSEILHEKIQACQYDVICGVAYTALPIATCLSFEYNIPMIMCRKEKKAYGTKKMIEGVFQPGQRCLIIEDVVTTGGSIIETANELEAVGLKVSDVVSVVNRDQGGKENLGTRGYVLHAALTLDNILQTLLRSASLSDKEREIINAHNSSDKSLGKNEK